MSRFVAHWPATKFAEEARRRALPWAEVASPQAVLANEQLVDRRFFLTLDAPDDPQDVGFGWTSPTLPDSRVVAGPRPTTAEEIAEHDTVDHADVTSDGGRSSLRRGAALDGLRVLDLTWVLAGPYVTKTLADHGAEIIKIESVHRKDPTRFSPGMRMRTGAGIDDSGYFLNFNRNKRSVALNLRTKQGLELLRRLIPTVDVVVENFSPDVLDRWDLGFDRLRELNPNITLVSMAGVGHTGPWRDAVTFADTLAAMSGLTAQTARADRAPQGLTFGLGDMVAANAAVVGLLELVLRGTGGHVDLSQLEAMTAHLGTGVLRSQLAPSVAPVTTARILATRGDDRWIAVGATPDDTLSTALQSLGTPAAEGEDPHEVLARVATARDADDLAADLQSHGVAAYAVRDGRDLVDHDPQLAERGFYSELDHPIAGRIAHEGLVVRLSNTPGGLWEAAPLLGAHTDTVLADLLDLTTDELSSLHEEGVLS